MSDGYSKQGDTYEIGIHTAGVDEARDLARALEKDEQALRAMTEAMAAHEKAAIKDADAIRRLAEEAQRAKKKLDDAKGGLSGTARAGAISRAGLLGANTLQDVIQGGPASGINNLLGAAGDKGIKALAGEFVAAAGGAKFLAGALGTIAVTAGAAFLVIDEGLKSNKLGWGDLGSVVDQMADGAFSKAGKVVGETFGSIRSTLGEIVGGVGEVTIGWNTAAEAVKQHKDEIDRATASLSAYEAAAKAISGIKSGEEKAAAEKGKAFGDEAAELGGAKGLKGVIDRIADNEAGADPDKEVEVEVNELDKDGKPTGNTTKLKKTRRQVATEAITQDFARAIGGDEGAQKSLIDRLGRVGMDGTNLGGREKADKDFAEKDDAAIKKEDDDRKWKKDRKKDAQAKQDKADADFARLDDMDIEKEDADRKWAKERKKGRKKTALEKGEKALSGTGADARIDDALLRSALKAGGKTGVASKEVAEQLSKELQGKGLSKEEADLAAKDQVDKHAAKLGDEVNDMTRNKNEPQPLRDVQRIGVADFARSVEGAGKDDQKKVADNTTAMKEQLAQLILQGNGPARLG